jgi:CubicO group peptidase (beta-lactamase class C family)
MSEQIVGRVEGKCEPGFEPVRDVFASNLGELGAGGAAFSVVRDGRTVVDLWAGASGHGRWSRDTRGVYMSATKGVTAAAFAHLMDVGLLDPDKRVAHYWPEFAKAGKEDSTVEQLMTHSIGLLDFPGYERIVSADGDGWAETDAILRQLEIGEPAWVPGTAHAYHGLTLGWLLGELVRRAAGKSLGAVVRDSIAAPLNLEMSLGTPAAAQTSVARILPAMPPATPADAVGDPTNHSLLARMLLTVEGENLLTRADKFFNRADILALELGGSNATGSARALARMYGTLALGGILGDTRIVSAAAVADATAERRRGTDVVWGYETAWALGFARPNLAEPARSWVPAPHGDAFGFPGWGGQIGFADVEAKTGFGFVRSHPSDESPLGRLLVTASYDALSHR